MQSRIPKRPKNKVTELGVAASIGDLSAVDYFLKVCGLSVDAADERGWRAIHHAALHGDRSAIFTIFRVLRTHVLLLSMFILLKSKP